MNIFDKLVVLSLPFAPKALVKKFAGRYIAGETLEEMLDTVRQLNGQGIMATIDLLGEFIHQPSEARQAAGVYKSILEAIARERLDANISVKLTQMGLLLDKTLCYEIMDELVSTAAKLRIFVRIDMEDSACTTDTIALYMKLRRQYDNVGIVLQAYLRRTLQDARLIMKDLDKIQSKGNFRLCKGIYVEPRPLAWKDHALINKNFTFILEEMFKQQAYVGIATHNEALVWEALRLIDQYRLKKDEYEFQMLLGVDPELRNLLLDGGHRLRLYVPFGKDWFAYCTRRLKENPSIARHILKNLFTPSHIQRTP
ncbi:proline dehydrogenase family protein [Vampirovibrio sp.]|uniref:proline dehydrogenase family protein n=1 Tax=Vampirovibrio sp. TaxID=2717857 RepID=UPI003592FF35